MTRRRAGLFLTLLLAALGAVGEPAPAAERGAREILPGIYRLRGIDPGLSHRDLRPLGKMLRRAELVGLGEAVHTTRGFSEAKFRLFRYLVEDEGFRAFGFESSWIDAEPVADYVRTCEGDAATAIQGLFGVWENEAVLDLVEWMCSYNREHPDDPVHFYGFDVQAQGGADIAALRDFMRRIGITESDDRWLGVGECTADFVPGAVIPADRHERCLAALAELERDLDDREAEIVGLVGREALAWARIHLVGLRAWEGIAFHFDSDVVARVEARDRGMAYVAEAIRAIRFPDARTALWAHNGHIAKDRFIANARVMGDFLERSLGRRYRSVALVAYEGRIDWVGVGCGSWRRATAASVEGRLHELGKRYLLVDLRFRGTDDKFLEPGAVYDLNWGSFIVPRRHFDALVYLEVAEKMRPVGRAPCDGG